MEEKQHQETRWVEYYHSKPTISGRLFFEAAEAAALEGICSRRQNLHTKKSFNCTHILRFKFLFPVDVSKLMQGIKSESTYDRDLVEFACV